MPQVLSYGYTKPESGDRGTANFYTPMEDNIQQINDHNHNGTNSAPLTSQSITGITQSILAINWVTYGGPVGFYRQLVTTSAGFLYDTVDIKFRLSTGEYIYPTVEKVSSTTFYVYINDNTVSLTALYGG